MFQLILESVKLHGDLVRRCRWRAAGRVSHFGGQRDDQISSQVHLWYKYCTGYQDTTTGREQPGDFLIKEWTAKNN